MKLKKARASTLIKSRAKMKNTVSSMLLCFLFYSLLLPNNLITVNNAAVICVPVADLFGQPLSSLYPDSSISERYTNMPICPGQHNASYACPRLHQLLYNDVVELIQKKQDEICIRTHHAFYIVPPSTTAQST